MMTFAAQVDWPLDDALGWPTKMIDEFAWERVAARLRHDGHEEPARRA